MKKFMLSILFVLLFLVSGCTNMNDRQLTISQGAGIGAVGGAAAGALIGQAIGHGTKSTLIGAGAGAMMGGLGGAAYGQHVANIKAQYAYEEEWLRNCIRYAENANRQVAIYISQLKIRNSRLKKEVKQLVKRYNQHKSSIAAMNQKKREVENKIAYLNSYIQEIYRQIAAYKNIRANVRTSSSDSIAQLDRQISELEAAALELENQTTALASINQRIIL